MMHFFCPKCTELICFFQGNKELTIPLMMKYLGHVLLISNLGVGNGVWMKVG